MSNDNYIKVDREDDGITVYCVGDADVCETFANDAAGERAALRFAERTARQLGCDWGCNF
jgi:hypothetical protein